MRHKLGLPAPIVVLRAVAFLSSLVTGTLVGALVGAVAWAIARLRRT